MNKSLDELTAAITDAVNQYIDDEECYNDNAQLRINTESGEITLTDSDDDDAEGCDYYPVMDLVCMSTDAPGQWEADTEAIAALAGDYTAA